MSQRLYHHVMKYKITMTTIIAALLTTIAVPAAASDWRAISIADRDIVYLEFEGMQKSGRQSTAWVWVISKDAAGRSFDNHKQLLQVDCEQNTLRTITTSTYLGTDHVGTGGAVPVRYAVPDSNGSAIVGAACGLERSSDIEPIPVKDPMKFTAGYFSGLSQRSN
jgi:hypothetical protein